MPVDICISEAFLTNLMAVTDNTDNPILGVESNQPAELDAVDSSISNSVFDARSDFSIEDRFRPWAMGQFHPDWKTALQREFRQYAPLSVILGCALLINRQRKQPDQLTGENAVIYFPNPDCFPRVNTQHYIGKLRYMEIIRGLVLYLEKGSQCAIGHEVDTTSATGVRLLPKTITRGDWSAVSLDENYEGESATAYFKMDDEARRGETVTGFTGLARPDLSRPAFKGVRFDVECWASIVEVGSDGHEKLDGLSEDRAEKADSGQLNTPARQGNPATLTKMQDAVVEAAKQLWPDGRIPPGTPAAKRDAAIQRKMREVSGHAPTDRTIREALSKAGWLK